MKKISICYLFILTVSLLIIGCVPQLVPTQTIDKVGIDVVLAAGKIEIISSESEEAQKMDYLGDVVGHSCMNKAWDHPATEVGATDQVRIAAAELGATAITDLKCEEGSLSIIKNCWQSWECRAKTLR